MAKVQLSISDKRNTIVFVDSPAPPSKPAGVSTKAFGVKSDGITDDRAALQLAIDSTAASRQSLFFERGSSYMKITSPLYVRSYSNWKGDAEIRNTATSADKLAGVLMPGGFNPGYFNSHNASIVNYTQYPINAVNSGRTITTTSASHASNFAVGDLVWVSTVKTWVGNAGDYPITAHLSEVLSVNTSTGAIVIDTPISESMAALYGNLQIANAEEAAVKDIFLNSMKLCRHASISGISLTSDTGSAIFRGGMYKCDFNFKNIRAHNGIFANAFVNTSVKVQDATIKRKLCDIAGFSNQFYVGIDSATYDGSIAADDLPAFSRVGECSRNGLVEVKSSNCAGYIDPDPLVSIDSGCMNVGQIHHNIVAPNHGEETNTGSAFRFQQGVSSNRKTYITAPLWTGNTAFNLVDRVSNNGIGYQCITSGTSAATGGPTGTGASITDGTAVWRYADNVAIPGQTVLNYGTTFDSQGASRLVPLKVYLNNVLLIEGAGAGKYQITGTRTTITLGTALVLADRVKIGLASDYQKTLRDCWMDITATLGGSAARAASISDSAQDANPPTVNHVKRCGFRNLKVEAPAVDSNGNAVFASTGQAVDIEGEHSYIHDAHINRGEIFVSSYADFAAIRGYYEGGAKNFSSNSSVRITSKKGLLSDVGNQVNDQILVQSTGTTDVLTANFPADSLHTDDRWIIRGTGSITGTNGVKKILFYRENGSSDEVYFTFTVPADVTGNFSLDIQLAVQTPNQYTVFGVLNLENSDSISFSTDTSIDLTASNTFVVGANVANTSDGVRFHSLDGVFKKPYHLN